MIFFNTGDLVVIGVLRITEHESKIKYDYKLDPYFYTNTYGYNCVVTIEHRIPNSHVYKFIFNNGLYKGRKSNIEEDYLYRLKIKLK